MRYTDLKILLSCHGLEDFPVYQKGDEAASLLANWTAMWHPMLVHACGSAPSWARIDDPPQDAGGMLLLVPLSNQHDLQTGFQRRVEEEGGRLISGETSRDKIVQEALQGIELDEGRAGREIDAERVADFYALGFCFLQIQILTRHMRYSSNLDEVYFGKQLVSAADAAVDGDDAKCGELLQSCFDVLAEERNHFYPVDAFLLDVTLVADTTLGKSLKRQLSRDHKQNLMMSAAEVEQLGNKDPSTLESLKAAINENRLEIVGGNYAEIPYSLMSQETLFRQFKRSLDVYSGLLGARPHVFARRRFGLSPSLPQILKQFDFRGAIHVTLDEGRFPEGMQAKTLWEGSGDDSIDALAKVPLEIDKPESFLNLGIKLGEAMDMDQLAVIWFAHWPDRHCDAFEDLVRCCRFGGALGKFTTLSEFFAETDTPLHSDRFSADEYQSPFLKQAVRSRHVDAISRGVRFWQRESKLEAVNSLRFLADVLGNRASSESDIQMPNDLLLKAGQEIDHAFELNEELGGGPESTATLATDVADSGAPGSDQQLDADIKTATARFVEAVPKADDKSGDGYLVINQSSFVRRMCVDVSALKTLPNISKPVYAAESSKGCKLAIVDVPPMGFAFVGAGDGSSKPNEKDPVLAEGSMLRNEFMEVMIDTASGGILAVHDYKSRGNRLSQKIALRYHRHADGSDESRKRIKSEWAYTDMVADSVKVTESSRIVGEIIARGKLVGDKEVSVATFTVTYRLERGSRVLQISVELESVDDPSSENAEPFGGQLGADPWNSYIGARFAWNSEAAELYRTVQQARETVTHQRLESSHYLEIEHGKQRTTVLNGGLAFFRQRGFRSTDMPMIVRGERSRKFEYGIGVDLTHPMQQAISLVAPKIVIPECPQPRPDHCWLFHIDSKNVIATWWEAIVEERKVVGFRVRLLETMGRSSTIHLSAMRPLTRAGRINFLGEAKSECRIEDGKLVYDLARRQFIELEAYWNEPSSS